MEVPTMNKIIAVFSILCALSTAAIAGELDQDKSFAPRGVHVRVDAKSNDATVYRSETGPEAVNDNVVGAITKTAKAQNAISEFKTIDLSKKSELDETTSTSAWRYYYYGNYWQPTSYFNYYVPNYNWAYSYNYNWAYSYNWGGYYWHWYWY